MCSLNSARNSSVASVFFSGIEFNVDAENGLTGVCDFLVSLSPARFVLEAPVIILVEAKKDDLTVGLGQCVARDACRTTL